jgi:pSer/pThr/pTyr-binding forkhead associated (FHA) protein
MPNSPHPRVAVRVVRADGGPEAVIPMRGESMLAGRSGDITVPDDPFVADPQMRLFFSGARLAVEDIGGGNGVFTRLRSERELSTGAEVRVGRQRLLVEAIPPLVPAEDGSISWGSPDPGARFRLVQMMEGAQRAAAWLLREGDNHIGREQGDVTFPHDGFVSGKHAIIHVAPEHLRIKDLGSSNGTFLRLAAPAFVENGDQFLIGRQLVRVEIG